MQPSLHTVRFGGIETLVDCVNGVGHNHSMRQRRSLLTPAPPPPPPSGSMEPTRQTPRVCFKRKLVWFLADVQMRAVINFYEPANQ